MLAASALPCARVNACVQTVACEKNLPNQRFANPSRHRSTNRMQRSTAGSHGETADFLNCGLPLFIQGANFSVNGCSCVRQCSSDLLSKLCKEANGCPLGGQLSTAMLDY